MLAWLSLLRCGRLLQCPTPRLRPSCPTLAASVGYASTSASLTGAVRGTNSSADLPEAPHCVVVGCGVIGLTTAILLQKHGACVSILAKSTPSTAPHDGTFASDKAGAHWFSFASLAPDDERQRALDELSFHALMGLAVTEPDCGVSVVRGHALFEKDGNQSSTPQLPWFNTLLPRFHVWTTSELAARSNASGIPYASAFSYDTCMIHPHHYLRWLYRSFLFAGGDVHCGPAHDLQHIAQAGVSLPPSALPPPSVVINCTGLGSASLGGVKDETLQADCGHTLLARCLLIDQIWRAPGESPTYVLPRGDGTVLLGGTNIVETDDNKRNESADADEFSAILRRCARLVPELRDTQNYELLDCTIGRRPARTSGPRIEIDTCSTHDSVASSQQRAGDVPNALPLLIHAYGHGGQGYQSSWGTAMVVVELIRRARPLLLPQTFHSQHSQVKTGLVQAACGPVQYTGT